MNNKLLDDDTSFAPLFHAIHITNQRMASSIVVLTRIALGLIFIQSATLIFIYYQVLGSETAALVLSVLLVSTVSLFCYGLYALRHSTREYFVEPKRKNQH
jgi:hypothetical protein